MRKLYLLLVLYLGWCSVLNKAQAQTAYPYFPSDSMRQNLAGVAVTVSNPSTYVADQSANFTLEGQGTATVPIQVANGSTAYSYTPASTATVRFVKRAATVYVYEGTVYKAIAGQGTTTASGISGMSGTVLHIPTSGLAPVITPNYAGGDYIDMTSFITNPSFENSFTGWVNNGMYTQGNGGIGNYKDGNLYVERWGPNPPLPNVSITQVIRGLPLGKYTVLAGGHNVLQNPYTNMPGAFLTASGGQAGISTPQNYALNFLVADTITSIGFKTMNSNANWTGVDNFRLQYRGPGQDSMRISLQALKDSGNTLLAKKMQNPVRTALTSTINAAQTVLNNPNSTQTELAAQIVQMRNAIDNAVASNTAYVTLQAAIDSARTVYGTGSGNQSGALLAVIQTNEALVNNLDASSPGLANGVTDLYNAIFAYRLANATGSVPTVVTGSNFARGATMAFGRSTVSGVATSDILEQGFCWSTSPQPTVMDSRTTKNFWNNGFIYRIENLQPATVYYMRAYAMTQNYAVGYGDVLKVITIPKGTVTYYLNSSVTESPGNYERIRDAVSSAVDYYNNLTTIQGHHISVHYSPGTPTADASYGGFMRFGPNASYQRTGTALHEGAHTLGVGTHWMWFGPNSPLRLYGTSGGWLGERANNVLRFLDNNTNGVMWGDAVHMWPYGINGANEDNGSEFIYTANALIVEGLGEDGLPPTGGFATPAYTFNQVDTAKYYIKTEEVEMGRDVAFLAANASGQLYNKIISATNVLANDSAAWYLTFDPSTGFYRIKNVATGQYFTYQSGGLNGITLTSVASPTTPHAFQLMGARYNTQITKNGRTLSLKAYSIVRPEYNLFPPCLGANLDASTSVVTYDFANGATTQHWLLMSKADVDSFKNVEGVNLPSVRSPRAASGDTKTTLTWDAQFGVQYAILRSATQTGTFDTVTANLNATRYVDGGRTNGSTYYYKIVGYNNAGSVSSPVLTTLPTLGQHLYISFNDTAIRLGEDSWGGYHARFANAAAKDSNSLSKYLRLNGDAYATLGEGTVSGLNNFTVSTWVKFNALNDWMRIFDFGSGTDKYMFLTPQSWNTGNGMSNVIYAIKNGSGEQSLSFPYAWTMNTWTHVALTQSNDSTKLYINGVQVAATNGILLRPADLGITNQNYIGKSQYNDPLLNGTIDEFRMYNYDLSKAQVQTLAGNAPIAAPMAVLAPRVASGDKRATLAWNFQDDVTYTVLRSSLLATGPYDTLAKGVNALRYVDSNRTNDVDYYYKVYATSFVGSSPATAAMAARPTQGRQVNISFDDNNAGMATDTWNAFDAGFAATASREAGRVGNALKLTGAYDSYATLYGSPVSELNDFTVSAWAKSNAVSDWMRIFDFGTGTNTFMFLTVQAGTTNGQSRVRYAMKNGGAEQMVEYPYTIPLNTWVHYVVSQSGNVLKLYINGNLVATNTNATLKPSSLGLTNQNYLGKAQFNDPLFNGSIDEFRIYNYALSDAEIMALSAPVILPIKLVSFEGKATPAGNLLRWKLVSTDNAMQLQLEKSSDARSFSSIYQATAIRSALEQLFSYADAATKESIAYYRLKMIDLSGKVTYSSVIAISTATKGIEIVGLYPSVVTTNAVLSVASAKATKLTLVITDMKGRTLQSLKRALVPGSNLLPVDATGLMSGTYFITVFENNIPLSTPIRFVVNR